MCGRGFKKLYKVNLGRTDYRRIWELQKRLVAFRRKGCIPDCLLFTEHNPVITMGRGTDRKNLLITSDQLAARSIDLVEIERGGDITFHGPGQLVAYPIIDLNVHGRDMHKYLRDLERLMIATLCDLGLESGIKDSLTGVWVGDQKVGAIGVAVSRWVTYHGLALNVNTDLDYFKLINPCGITRYPVGAVASILNKNLTVEYVADIMAENFARMFNYEMEEIKDISTVLNQADGGKEMANGVKIHGYN
jgi:lipoate-protein ligase B